jgi:hypothetical protein
MVFLACLSKLLKRSLLEPSIVVMFHSVIDKLMDGNVLLNGNMLILLVQLYPKPAANLSNESFLLVELSVLASLAGNFFFNSSYNFLLVVIRIGL